jgi:seryl-tRNA synthetase
VTTVSQPQNQVKYIKIGEDIDDKTLKSTNVIDLSSQKLERLDKKNVSWGNNEYQEFGQQNSTEIQNTLFSKLKYVAPNNNEVSELKSEINDLKIQISVLNDKFDRLLSKFT